MELGHIARKGGQRELSDRRRHRPARRGGRTLLDSSRPGGAAPPDLGSPVGQILGEAGRTIGYHTTERLLPVDRRIYVLGESVDSADGLTIQAPSERGKRFIISTRSEEELVGSATQWLLVGAVASGAIGVILFVVSLVTRVG